MGSLRSHLPPRWMKGCHWGGTSCHSASAPQTYLSCYGPLSWTVAAFKWFFLICRHFKKNLTCSLKWAVSTRKGQYLLSGLETCALCVSAPPQVLTQAWHLLCDGYKGDPSAVHTPEELQPSPAQQCLWCSSPCSGNSAVDIWQGQGLVRWRYRCT